MSIHHELQYAELDDLNLDPMNPRLGRNNTGSNVKQAKILEVMQDWKLDEWLFLFWRVAGSGHRKHCWSSKNLFMGSLDWSFLRAIDALQLFII